MAWTVTLKKNPERTVTLTYTDGEQIQTDTLPVANFTTVAQIQAHTKARIDRLTAVDTLFDALEDGEITPKTADPVVLTPEQEYRVTYSEMLRLQKLVDTGVLLPLAKIYTDAVAKAKTDFDPSYKV